MGVRGKAGQCLLKHASLDAPLCCLLLREGARCRSLRAPQFLGVVGELPMSLGEFYKQLYDDKNMKKLNWHMKRMRLNAALVSKAKTRER